MAIVRERSVVIVDDEENVRVGLEIGLRKEGYEDITTLADTGAFLRYTLSSAFCTPDEGRWQGPMPEEGTIHHHHLVDLNMPTGNLPQRFSTYLEQFRPRFPKVVDRYPIVFAIMYAREMTGYDLFAGTMTGELDTELDHPELVRALKMARFQYRQRKDHGFRHPARVLRRIERHPAEEIGMGDAIVGAGGSGKSNIVRLSNSQQRGLPKPFDPLHAHAEIYGGTYTHHKLTDNEYPDTERFDLRKLHHDSFFVKRLGELAPYWRRLDDLGHIVYYESKRANPHHHLWVMTKAGEQLVTEALKEIEPDFHYKKNTISAESISRFKDWTTITTNIRAGEKLLEYGSRFTLMMPIKISISDKALLERNAYRGGFSDNAYSIATSNEFLAASPEKREMMLRSIKQGETDEPLVDEHGKLTDFAQRLKISLEQNEAIKAGFNPQNVYVFDANNMISEMYRLQETHFAIRREYAESGGMLLRPLEEIIDEVKKELESEL